MAASCSPYDLWLSDKLLSLNEDVDTDVFVSYISAILDETDTPDEEKKESLASIIGEVTDSIESVCNELIEKWNEFHKENLNANEHKTADLSDRFSQILRAQKLPVAKERQLTSEELARKQAILAHYRQMSDDDDEEAEEETTKKSEGDGDNLVLKNINKDAVMRAEREKREKAKQEYERKKEKDKKDRENQKQKLLDRKEAEKKRTQKGEKRR